MKLGLLLPALLMHKRYNDRIFAPKALFLWLVDELVKRGHTVYVYSVSGIKTKGISVSGDALLEQEDLPSLKLGLDASSLGMRYKPGTIEYEVDLTSLALVHARNHGVELIHSFHDFLIRYFARLIPEIPVIYTLHDPIPPKNTLEGWRFDHFSKENYVGISQRQADLYRERVKIAGVVLHGLPSKDYIFSPKKGAYLAFMGRLIPQKGAFDAILVSQALQIPLKIASSPFYFGNPYFVSKIKPHINKTLISLHGYLVAEARSAFLNQAQALLFPIKWEEPFGMVMIEAMACGTPVIAYNRGSVSEVIKDGVTGFVIDPDDEERPGKASWVIKKKGVAGMIEAMKRIDEIDRAACRKHIEENFTVAKMAEGYEKVYKKVLSS